MKKIDWESINIKEFAGLISSYLRKNRIDAVLVGGACVSIYTNNKYLSYDLDYITYESVKKIESILNEFGFKREGSRYLKHKECQFILDFPKPPVELGNECPVTNFNRIKTKNGIITLLTPTDCVKDRLAHYIHWSDPQCLEQAILVSKSKRINFNEVKKWAINEGALDKFKTFEKVARKP